jgi:hypothetical protein
MRTRPLLKNLSGGGGAGLHPNRCSPQVHGMEKIIASFDVDHLESISKQQGINNTKREQHWSWANIFSVED